MPGPLDGVRVVELPAIGPVPFAGMLLADLGAEVTRIDRLAPTGPFDALVGGPLGRGRRSIGVDLRRPGGAEIVLRLGEESDVLIEGFRPGVAERLGVGPDVVLRRNPRLVYGRMTGWGQSGPLATTAGHDITYLAVSGVLHGIGRSDRPVPPVNYVADFGGGAMFLVAGVLAAVLHARSSGVGQVVDAAMTEGAAYLSTMTRVFASAGAWSEDREANLLDGGAPNYRCYECADGRFVAVGALEPQFWARLVAGLDLPDDVPSPDDRDQWPACAAMLAAAFATRTRDEWAEHFGATDACVAPVLTLAEAATHPHNTARGSFTTVGDAVVAGPAPRFAATPAHAGTPVPAGRDTVAVLTALGYSAGECDALRESGTIG